MNKKLKRYLAFLLIICCAACSSSNIQVAKISIKGSDNMLILTQLLAEEYMKKNPGISIYVDGGGSAAGLKALSQGRVDICAASRTITAEEIKDLAEKFGSIGLSHIIAKDALSIYVNEEAPKKDFTMEELKRIFTGQISNWEEMSDDNSKIILIIRDNNSGTFLYFKQHVLDGENYSKNAVIKPTTNGIIELVDENKYAIGYGGIGYGDNIEHAKINGVEPSEENVKNNTYPISRYLYFYTVNTPDKHVSNFIDWVISSEGQRIVRRIGYIPVWESPY